MIFLHLLQNLHTYTQLLHITPQDMHTYTQLLHLSPQSLYTYTQLFHITPALAVQCDNMTISYNCPAVMNRRHKQVLTKNECKELK